MVEEMRAENAQSRAEMQQLRHDLQATRTVLETMPLFTDTPEQRAWNYVTLGDGHDETFWRRFLAALADAGYTDVLSIEHEDTTIDPVDGIRRTVDLLRRVSPVGVS